MNFFNKITFTFSLIALISTNLIFGQGVNYPESINDIKIPKSSITEYKADLAKGIIGVYDEKIGDSPDDNIFQINIKDPILPTDKVNLSYEVFGVQYIGSVSRSLNDAYNLGGGMLKRSREWTSVIEPINPHQLRVGKNTLVFNAYNKAFPYKVKNVKIIVSHSDETEKTDIILSNNVFLSKENKIYLRGYISNLNEKNIEITANGIKLMYNGYEFEGLVAKNKSISIKVIQNKKTIFQKTIEINKTIEADKLLHYNDRIAFKSYTFKKKTNQSFSYQSAEIIIGDSVLSQDKLITIAHLRKIDILPLNEGMVNVTSAKSGYRFLPDGTKFDKPILVSIPYDKNTLPKGYTENDIHSFYFDKQKRKWVILRTKKVDKNKGVIISYTTHFTDYINGVIKMPESPESTSYTPTTMTGIKAASPFAGIDMIQPPTASQTGEASISYPIDIPSGRKGMQPSISINYNSDGGNGTLGMGWSIPFSSITVDTRWGVPRFNKTKESEIYSLDGQQLMYPKQEYNGEYYDFMPNRPLMVPDANNELHPITEDAGRQNRNASRAKTFTLRKQNKLIKIERFGYSPSTYYWKVTNENGTINWYGGDENNGISDECVLRNSDGNIAQWALVKTIDVYGNTVNYHYHNTEITGMSDPNTNLNGGRFFAIKSIDYTGKDNTAGNYKVEFLYDGIDQDGNITNITREDIRINYKRTVKEVEPFLLQEIKVLHKENLIRKYLLNYIESRWTNKKLLYSVKKTGTNKEEILAEKIFHYFDRGSSGKDYMYEDIPIEMNITDNWIDYLTTAEFLHDNINFATSYDYGFKLRGIVGIELIRNSKTKLKNLNVTFGKGWDWLKNQGKVTLLDFNGDGLKDIVFYGKDPSGRDNKLFFIPHEIDNNGTHHFYFNNKVTSFDVLNFFKSSGERKDWSLEFAVDFEAINGVVSLGYVRSNDTQKIYITDGNGDGLPDIVKAANDGKATVYFNHLDADGRPHFTTSSKPTENVISTGSSITDYPEPQFTDDPEDPDDNYKFPKYDLVKVWVAPRDGQIKITGGDNNGPTSFNTSNSDKVILTIETADILSGNIVVDSDYYAHYPVGDPYLLYSKVFDNQNMNDIINITEHDGQPIMVKEGQTIFFRQHVINNDDNTWLYSDFMVSYMDGNHKDYPYNTNFILDDDTGFDIDESEDVDISWADFDLHPHSELNSNYKVEFKIIIRESTGTNFQDYVIFEKSFDQNNIGDVLSSNFNGSGWNTNNLPLGVTMTASPSLPSRHPGARLHFDIQSSQDSYKLLFTHKILNSNGSDGDTGISNSWGIGGTSGDTWGGLTIDVSNTSTNPTVIKTTHQIASHNFFKRPLPNGFGGTFSKQIMGPLQGGWGQFMYASNIVDRTPAIQVPNTDYNFINPILVYNWQNPDYLSHGIAPLLGIDSNSTTNSVSNSISNFFANNGVDINNPNQTGVNGFFPSTGINPSDILSTMVVMPMMPDGHTILPPPTEEGDTIPVQAHKARWVSPYNHNIYVTSFKMFGKSSEDMFFPFSHVSAVVDSHQQEAPTQSFDSDYGMHAIFTKSKNRTRTISAGVYGINAAWSHAVGNKYSFVYKQFMDLNGDGYPDILQASDTDEGIAQLTNMLGGHNSKISWKYAMSMNKRDNVGVLTTFNGMTTGTRSTFYKYHGVRINGNQRQLIIALATASSIFSPGMVDVEALNLINANPVSKLSDNLSIPVPLYDNSSDVSFWADINGDGLPDRIFEDGGSYSVEFNDGRGGTFMEPQYAHNLPFNNLESAAIYGKFPSASYNMSGSSVLGEFTSGTNSVLDSSGSFGVELNLGASMSGDRINKVYLDYNGDGLVDILYAISNSSRVYYLIRYNLGNRFSEKQSLPVGLPTLLKHTLQTSFSASGGLTGQVGILLFPPPVPPIYLKIGGNLTGSFSFSLANTRLSFMDFDGDGFTDVITHPNNPTDDYHHFYTIRDIYKKDKLSSVSNCIVYKNNNNYQAYVVNSFDLDYIKTKPTYDNPHVKVVLHSVKVNDIVRLEFDNGDDADGPDTYETLFDYQNGRYDRRERMFYGFGTVIEKKGKRDTNGTFETLTQTVSKYHNQNYFLHGLLKEQYLQSGTDQFIYNRTANEYTLKYVDNDGFLTTSYTGNIDEFDKGGEFGYQQAAVLLSATSNYNTDRENTTSGVFKKLEVFEYDNYGRVTMVKSKSGIADDLTANNFSIEFDVIISSIDYHHNQVLEEKNILAVPKDLKVYVGNDLMRHRKTIVNNFGAIEGLESYFSTGQGYLTTKFSYDNYGNIEGTHLPSGMYYYYKYGSEHKFVVYTVDAFNYESSMEPNYLFDVPDYTIDIAGNKVSYSYDTYGRTTRITGPNEQGSSNVTIEFEYLPYNNSPNNEIRPLAITHHFDPQHPNNKLDTYTFVDGLGRTVQVKKDVAINGVEKMTCSGATIYDDYGRVIKQYHPSSEAKDPNVNKVPSFNANVPHTETVYDEIGRVKESHNELGIVSNTLYGIENVSVFGHDIPAYFVKSIVPQNTSQTIVNKVYKNINGSTIATVQNPGQNQIKTDFDIDPLGQLKRYIDSREIMTSYKYDMLGRKLSVSSRDYGTINYYYDEQKGNLAAMQTAELAQNHQLINYEYDKGRIELIKFPEVDGHANIANVSYKYGNTGNKTGRIIYQEDATGTQEFDYDKLGNVMYIARKVVVPDGQTVFFETKFNYDTWNRIQSITYPDGEEVGYFYDLGGNLTGVVGNDVYIKDILYDEYEQRTQISYGNEVITNYTYSPELRRLNNMSVGGNSGQYLNMDYQYDLAGNITRIENTAQSTNALLGQFTHSYDYDPFNRLKGGIGHFTGNNNNTSNYRLEMRYNSTYGITSKNQEHYRNGNVVNENSYDSEYEYLNGTHKLKKIGYNGINTSVTTDFDYDKNGNLTHQYTPNVEDTRMSWDEVNRLRAVKNETGFHYYLYDAGGERIIKADSREMEIAQNGQIMNGPVHLDAFKLYPNAYTVTNGDRGYTNHYYAGTQRIASRVSGDFPFTVKESGDKAKMDKLHKLQIEDLKKYLQVKQIRFAKTEPQKPIDTLKKGQKAPVQLYFFHPNHLGTGTLITDMAGNPHQFFQNLPFGETMVELGGIDYDNPYKFNGKELDEETGNYYYGARYYNPKVSQWLSVDPLAEKYAGFSPYNYTLGNPVMLVDPNGKDIIIKGKDADKAYKQIKNKYGKHLNFTFKGGKLIATARKNVKLTDAEALIIKASSDHSIRATITSSNELVVQGQFNPTGKFLGSNTTGAFLGSKYDRYKNIATSYQLVNPDVLSKIDKLGDEKVGTTMAHELIENILGAYVALAVGIVLNQDVILEPKFKNNESIYDGIHKRASTMAPQGRATKDMQYLYWDEHKTQIYSPIGAKEFLLLYEKGNKIVPVIQYPKPE